MVNKAIRVGLLGLGVMGVNHLRVLNMLKGVEISFIYDQDLSRSQFYSNMYQVNVAKDLQEEMSLVDGVIIATPTSTHAEYIQIASNFVNYIFVEKPMVSNLKEVDKINDLKRKNSALVIQVGFIERFNPAVVVLKNVLNQANKLINLDFFRTNKLSSRIVDVDVISDLMIHDIDLALFINGPVLDVDAHGYGVADSIDFASTLLKHTNGSFSRLLSSRVTDKKIRKIEATCIDKYIDCDLLKKEVMCTTQSKLTQLEGQPYVISGLTEAIEVKPQEALLLELQAFISIINGGSFKSVPLDTDGIAALEVAEEIRKKILREY